MVAKIALAKKAKENVVSDLKSLVTITITIKVGVTNVVVSDLNP